MADPTVRMPELHPGQQAILAGARRFNWLVAGRRWFKTSLGVHIAIVAGLRGERIIWGAPTYDQVRIAFEQIDRMAHHVLKANQSRMEMKFASGGGSILFRSFDNPDNARGHTANGVIMDEVADLAADAWIQVLRPMLMTTKGWSWGFGTPKGGNWLFKEYGDALRSVTDGAASSTANGSAAWRAPTLGYEIQDGQLIRKPHPYENSKMDPAEIEALWRSMPERVFRQEILAEFTEDSGGVFRGVREVSTLLPAEPLAGHQYVLGIDWARSIDFSALAVLDVTDYCQVALDRFNQIGWQLQRDRIKQLVEKYNVLLIIAEENAIGSPNVEALIDEGLPVVPFYTTQPSKDALIGDLSLAIERQSIGLLRDEVQIGELEAYEMTRSAGGGYRYSAPEGGHDDTVMALALALHAARRFGQQAISFVDRPIPPGSEAEAGIRADVRAYLLGEDEALNPRPLLSHRDRPQAQRSQKDGEG